MALHQDDSKGYRIFQVINNLFFLFVIFVTAYPIYYVVIASFSDPSQLAINHGMIWAPFEPFTLDAYRRVLANPLILSGYGTTLYILIFGLLVNLTMTVIGAYILTLTDLYFYKPIVILVLFTMYFGGGMIPEYLNIRDLGLIDNRWSLILPGAISTYNMLILRSAFKNVPESLVEAADIDGASHIQKIVNVMLPLTGATIAVLVLYYGVGHWNSWFHASIYITDTSKYPLALVLRRILLLNQDTDMLVDTGSLTEMRDLIKYALIVVSTAPILCLYPFLQRYFVKGVMVGAVKG